MNEGAHILQVLFVVWPSGLQVRAGLVSMTSPTGDEITGVLCLLVVRGGGNISPSRGVSASSASSYASYSPSSSYSSSWSPADGKLEVFCLLLRRGGTNISSLGAAVASCATSSFAGLTSEIDLPKEFCEDSLHGVFHLCGWDGHERLACAVFQVLRMSNGRW
jgi:hypothetical protein